MKKIKGTSRIVFIFPNIGIVIKIPQIRIIDLFKAVKKILNEKRKNKAKFIFKCFTKPLYSANDFNFKALLFKGLADNFNEFLFFISKRYFFCQPTYFSFLGFFSIQRYGEVCVLDNRKLSNFFKEIFGEPVFVSSGAHHHFRRSINFSLYDGKIFMHDYGDYRVQKLLLAHEEKLKASVEKIKFLTKD